MTGRGCTVLSVNNETVSFGNNTVQILRPGVESKCITWNKGLEVLRADPESRSETGEGQSRYSRSIGAWW